MKKIFKPTEKETQKAILEFLKTIGALPIKIYNGGIYDPKYQKYFFPYQTQKGVSDIIVCYKGRFVAIEVKSPSRKPTPDQIQFLKEVEKAGGLGFWTDDIDDVINFFNNLKI
jgi:penicillin-binding protein-related factor A (putative recombinase)